MAGSSAGATAARRSIRRENVSRHAGWPWSSPLSCSTIPETTGATVRAASMPPSGFDDSGGEAESVDVRRRGRNLPPARDLGQASAEVIVVGSGAMGAAIAYTLARNDIRVTCIDLDVHGAGVTGSAFGWIGTTHIGRGTESHHDAIADFRALDADLGGALPVSWTGSSTWFQTPEHTEKHVRTQQGLGFPTEAVDAEGFTRLEPAVASRPQVAAYSPHEGVVTPGRMRRTLLAAARDLGARVVEAAVSEVAVGMRVHRALDAIRRDFGLRNPLQLLDFRVGFQPIPASGRPYLGALRTAPQVLVACMHSGITSAPSAARRVLDHVVGTAELASI